MEFINVIIYTCAFPTVTYQNVCCEKGQYLISIGERASVCVWWQVQKRIKYI